MTWTMKELKKNAMRIAKIKTNKITPKRAAQIENDLAEAWAAAQHYLNTTPNGDDNDPKAPGRPWSGTIQYKLIELREEISLKQQDKKWEAEYMEERLGL